MSSPGFDYDRLKQIMDVEMLPFTAACRVRHLVFGKVVTHPAYCILYDLNMVLLDRLPEEMNLFMLEDLVRPIFTAAGVSHRRFMTTEPEVVRALHSEFESAGYVHNRFQVMEVRAPSTRESSPLVKIHPVLGPEGFRVVNQIEGELLSEVPWDSPVIRSALSTRRQEITEHLDMRWFWASIDDVPVGSIGLLRSGTIASIQDVSTRPRYRNQGIATTMVTEMVRLAGSLGHSTVSLITEAGDWPKYLYEKIGFRTVGYSESFLLE